MPLEKQPEKGVRERLDVCEPPWVVLLGFSYGCWAQKMLPVFLKPCLADILAALGPPGCYSSDPSRQKPSSSFSETRARQWGPDSPGLKGWQHPEGPSRSFAGHLLDKWRRSPLCALGLPRNEDGSQTSALLHSSPGLQGTAEGPVIQVGVST